MLKSGKKNIGKNITELKKDNLKSGKAKWANWVVRPAKQILAIALSKAGVKKMPMKSKEMSKMDMGKKEMKVEKKEYKKPVAKMKK